MNKRRWSSLIAAAVLALMLYAASAAAAAPGPAGTAAGYLRARAAAVTATDPGAVLAPWLGRGKLATKESLVATGTDRRAAQLGHRLDAVRDRPTILSARLGRGGRTATVRAHVITTTAWHAGAAADSEASGIDHVLTLRLSGGCWLVTGDEYDDQLLPAYLEAAGASATMVRRAAARLEKPSPVLATPAAPPSVCARSYNAIITYDRDAARAYADKYALHYNPTFVSFDADCANFASQCGRAGDMPMASGDFYNGWWYAKAGTSSPSDDSYSLSWINVPKQMNFWYARRVTWADAAGDLSRGDFVYYDWTGNGTWDHVAVVTGTNSAGQRIVDAHTTDYYHVMWKLGSSATHYKFAHVRAQWII
jgi:cell wall-associated NlpC family hydrolase